MDPGALILVIIFIVAPLIERLLKAGKSGDAPDDQQRVPPSQRAPQRIPPRETPRSSTASTGTAEREDDAAAAMLPDDLWEILTGERRTPLPAPSPEENYEDYEEQAYSLEDEAIEEYASGGMLPAPAEPVSLETFERPLPDREPPRVVSLEQLAFDDRKRHEKFHDRLDELQPAARVQRPTPSAYRFTTDEDMRRAIIMSEILGPPKGLE